MTARWVARRRWIDRHKELHACHRDKERETSGAWALRDEADPR